MATSPRDDMRPLGSFDLFEATSPIGVDSVVGGQMGESTHGMVSSMDEFTGPVQIILDTIYCLNIDKP